MATRPRRSPNDTGDTLFAASAKKKAEAGAPLADRMRPHTLAELVGQKHVLGPQSLLTQAITADRVRSMILWGPPGSGKTTLARVIAGATQSHFVPFSAVLGSVGELREIVGAARDRLAFQGQRTIVFVDEIHRFNKAQQDAFLPHVEDGTIDAHRRDDREPVLRGERGAPVAVQGVPPRGARRGRPRRRSSSARCATTPHGLGAQAPVGGRRRRSRAIAEAARGDARRALSTLEIVADWMEAARRRRELSLEAVAAAESHRPLLYDKAGEEHYNVVSAFIKSMRGSDPDAAVYWMMRMLEAGDDPLFVSRRMMIFASEDIGNADPRALVVAIAADATLRRMGMPEGHYAARAGVHLPGDARPSRTRATPPGTARRSSSRSGGALPVPMKLRNAVTPLMREEGYGAGYRYAHDFEGGVVPGRDVPARRARGRRSSTSRPTAGPRRPSGSVSPPSAGVSDSAQEPAGRSRARRRRGRRPSCGRSRSPQ